jgi:alpha-glucosidase (family GH31 glycosyl hydrolase)
MSTPLTISDLMHTDALEITPGRPLVVALAGGHWYGHGFAHVQPYPLETGEIVNPRFAVNNIQCPLWLCSAGLALLADTNALLAVRINAGEDGLLVVEAEETVPVRIFRGATLVEAHRAVLDYVGWPAPLAPTSLGDSLFCTWTHYPRCLTQGRILDYARAIRASGYPCSTLLIDDRWESCFGELTFSQDFPDPARMFTELKEMGMDAWVWVTPFVNEEAATFPELEARRILVPRHDGTGAARLRWWGGTAGLVDVTAPAGRAWLRERLAALLALGATGFKVDGGDFKYQPDPSEGAYGDFRGPSGYSDALLSLFEEVAPGRCETRTAWRSQGRQILWREGGKDSHWGLDNGLAALVTLGLHSALLGYDLLIPDMVPGRVQTMATDFPLPSDELMLRWTEASALFPIVQFSYAPWNYASATERAVHGYACLHKALEPYLYAQAADRTAPLLRPLWYADPECAELYPVGDAFLLGSDLLAAPVLTAGTIARDVLLPPGAWIDAWTGAQLSGGWLQHYPAPCPGIPLFVRAENPELLATVQEALGKIVRGSVPFGVTTTTYQAGLDRDLNVTG